MCRMQGSTRLTLVEHLSRLKYIKLVQAQGLIWLLQFPRLRLMINYRDYLISIELKEVTVGTWRLSGRDRESSPSPSQSLSA